ncbi:LysR family transcriptional regulator [Coxiella burnetii]|uniref:LysR family transcriptional regulator n=1 Tax=Coxiella burnetii TaxID=777 RepID=UPI000B958A7F|nr:LysR family transcriptional regulator [Coxiella burnetii]OYK80471.1 LysR family transcriptional regulator [Coxiella burnetii]
MTLPSLHHFEAFLCVAESGGFTPAAKQLGISKAAVSHTIRLLEESLRTPLFVRDTRNIRLTEEGELLFSQCKRLKEELDAARNLVAGFNSSPSGTLRMSCNPYFAETHLFDLLQTYTQRFPKVKVELLVEERMPNMEREKIDIVFGINWPAPSDVVAKTIDKTRYVLCASPKYLNKFGIPKTVKALEQHRYIPHLGRSPENVIMNLKNKVTLNLTPQLKLNNAHLIKKCALNGLGIIQLHDYMVKEELANGSLVEVLKDHFQAEIPIYIYYQKHRFVQPKVRQFINLVNVHFSG